MRVVLDTSVLVSASRSRQGASFALLSLLPSPKFEICLSVGLYTEWKDVLLRTENLPPGMSAANVLGFLRYLASQAHLQEIHYLWRPMSKDADDDMIIELAFAAGCEHIITHNVGDFAQARQLGVTAVTPGQFLEILRSTT